MDRFFSGRPTKKQAIYLLNRGWKRKHIDAISAYDAWKIIGWIKAGGSYTWLDYMIHHGTQRLPEPNDYRNFIE